MSVAGSLEAEHELDCVLIIVEHEDGHGASNVIFNVSDSVLQYSPSIVFCMTFVQSDVQRVACSEVRSKHDS